MTRMNCWEFKKCGRQPGGGKAGELGVCPAAVDAGCDGMNRGSMGGRACWALAGTLCGGVVQGSFAGKAAGCQNCEFYKLVKNEEGPRYCGTREILRRRG